MAAGSPLPVEMSGRRVWNLPIVLSPKSGGPTDVGSVFVDNESIEVVGATNEKQVLQNLEALGENEQTVLV